MSYLALMTTLDEHRRQEEARCIICGEPTPAGTDHTTVDALVQGRLHHYTACTGFCTHLVLGYLVDHHADKLGMRRKLPDEAALPFSTTA